MSIPDVDGHAHTVTFVGTATTILRLGPFTVLTDPNFISRGQTVPLGYGLRARRRSDPAMTITDLPALDAVVLSHLHGDHFDRVARRGLDRGLPVLTTPSAAKRLTRWGFGAAQGMRTWEAEELHRDGWSLRVTSVPGVHGPGPLARLLPSVMGTVLELAHGGSQVLRLYISGDTLLRPFLRDVVERLGPLDTALVHLGATRVAGVTLTMTAADGAELASLLSPRVTLPIHIDDYNVFHSTPQGVVDAWRDRGAPGTLRLLARGETASLLPPAPL